LLYGPHVFASFLTFSFKSFFFFPMFARLSDPPFFHYRRVLAYSISPSPTAHPFGYFDREPKTSAVKTLSDSSFSYLLFSPGLNPVFFFGSVLLRLILIL